MADAFEPTNFTISSSLWAKTTGEEDFRAESLKTLFASSAPTPSTFSVKNFIAGEEGSRMTTVMLFPVGHAAVLPLRILARSARERERSRIRGIDYDCEFGGVCGGDDSCQQQAND